MPRNKQSWALPPKHYVELYKLDEIAMGDAGGTSKVGSNFGNFVAGRGQRFRNVRELSPWALL
jgi:hypothetical protein